MRVMGNGGSEFWNRVPLYGPAAGNNEERESYGLITTMGLGKCVDDEAGYSSFLH